MGRLNVLIRVVVFCVAAVMASMPKASAEDTVKVAVARGGAWETAAAELGQKAGIFKKNGIVLDLNNVDDAEEAKESVISGRADIGLGVSVMAAMQAYDYGAPIRIIGANLAGSPNYWYVLQSSPIRTYKDMAGRSVGYERNGSSSQFDAIDFTKKFRIKAKLVPTGDEAPTLEQLKSGQVDVGWAAPPFGFKEIEEGTIRAVARATDVPNIQKKTVSVIIANAAFLQQHKDVAVRFLRAYRESIDWMYSDPTALQSYAEYAGASDAVARRLREFFPKPMLAPDTIVGVSAIGKDADALGYLRKPLSRRQLRELIQIPISPADQARCFGGGGAECPVGILP